VKGDVSVTYRTIYPEATESQWKRKNTMNFEKNLKVFKLKKDTTR
jgi:hypothetical protein